MSIAGKSTRFPRQGFTLFELLVVIAILAVMAGLVAPSIDLNVGSHGVEGTVDFIQRVLDQGRNYARLRQSNASLVFKPSGVLLEETDKEIPYPESVRFLELVFAADDELGQSVLTIDRRGVVPASILRMEVGDQVYSFFLSPVLREVKYGLGIMNPGDFTH